MLVQQKKRDKAIDLIEILGGYFFVDWKVLSNAKNLTYS